MIQTEQAALHHQGDAGRAYNARKSSLTDLDAKAHAKLIQEHQAAYQSPVEVKMPSFGIEDLDQSNNVNGLQAISIGLGRIQLSTSGVKRASQLTASEDSDRSMDSSEENDKVGLMGDTMTTFRQIDYLWLFDSQLKFSERQNFALDDVNVTAEDFLHMREINRRVLTNFCKEKQREVAIMDGENPEQLAQMDAEDEKEAWADENIDETIKVFLESYENGQSTPVDIISHLEYFYNTLDCGFSVKNPFEQVSNYPVLLYREPASSAESSNSQTTVHEKTLFEKHRALIFPQSHTSKSHSKSQGSSDISPCAAGFLNVNPQFSVNTAVGSQGSNLTAMLLPKQYRWYPNMSIVSPKCSQLTISPSPKNVSSYFRRGSAAVPNNPYQRVSGQFQQPVPVQHPAHACTFGESVDNYDQIQRNERIVEPLADQDTMPRMSLIKNVSAIKGRKATKVPENLQALMARKTDSERQRKSTVLDQPIQDNQFEMLSTSANNRAKEGKNKSVLVDTVQDFDFNNFM